MYYRYDRRPVVTKTAADEVPGTAEFIRILESHLNIGDRRIIIRPSKSMGFDKTKASVWIDYINLPKGMGGAGGGAEAENNRFSVGIDGFTVDGTPPDAKVKAESRVAYPRELRMRAKSGTVPQVAKYVADYFSHIAKTVEPRYTHSKPPG